MRPQDTTPSERYRAFSTALDRASQWTESYTETRIAETRFGGYRNLHQRLISGAILKKEDMAVAVESLLDCQELIAMHLALAAHTDRGHISARLRRMLDGPEQERDEDSDTGTSGARDAQFELMLGAQFSLGGLAVSFPGDADLLVTADSTQCRIECKRPRSDRGIRRRIIQAGKQLEEARLTGEQFVGIIALSVNLLARPPSHLVTASREDEIRREYRSRVDRVVQRYASKWRERDFPAVDAVVISHSGMSHARDNNRWLRAEEVSFVPIRETADVRAASRELGAALNSAADREWF